MSDTAKRKLAEAYKQYVEGTYVEPGHDVAPTCEQRLEAAHGYADECEAKIKFLHEQIAELTDAIDRLQQRIAELERKASW